MCSANRTKGQSYYNKHYNKKLRNRTEIECGPEKFLEHNKKSELLEIYFADTSHVCIHLPGN